MAMVTFTKQIANNRIPLAPEIRVLKKESRMATKMSGVARAFSRRTTSMPSGPRSALPIPNRIGLFPNQTPRPAPTITPTNTRK